MKVEFDASMISCTIKLTRVQVLDRSCTSFWIYSALFTIKQLYRLRILCMTPKSIKWTCAEPFKMNVEIEQELNFVGDDSRLFLDAQEAKKVNERTVVR